MSFDRHAILKKHYLDEMREWSWDWVAKSFESNAKDSDCYELDDDMKHVYLFIGSVLSMLPSGKIYAPWTTNQTRADVAKDEAWWEALAEVCEEHGCYVSTPDGCAGDDIFLCKSVDNEAPDDDGDDDDDDDDDSMDGDHASALASAGWGTDEDYEHHD